MRSIFLFSTIFSSLAVLYIAIVFDHSTIGFFLLMLGSVFMTFVGYSVAMITQPSTLDAKPSTAQFNILVGLLAVVGVFAIYYDRTVIRGIDYSAIGIAAARAEINRVGERGGTISNFGNLFSVAIYLPLINLIFDWEKWSRVRYFVLAIVIVGLAGLTYLTAGRTVILVAIALVAAAMFGRGASGLPRLPSFLTPARLLVSLAALMVVFGMIFSLRADAFGVANAGDYLSQLCVHLSQPAIEIMTQCSSTIYNGGSTLINNLTNYATAVILYAFHVAWVSDAVIADNGQGVAITFVGIQSLFLSRFGYVVEVTDYDGYFIPAASGLVHDFGYPVTIAVFLVMGFLMGTFLQAMQRGRMFLGRVAFCYICAALLLSLLISPLSLPFYVLSMLAIAVIGVITNLFTLLGIASSNRRPVSSRVNRR